MVSKPRVKLTARDLSVLADTANWGVLSLNQLRRRHFAGLALSVSSERITRLSDAGLISKQRVGILMHHGQPKEIGSVVTLKKVGLGILIRAGLSNPKQMHPRPLNTAELHHDLLLVDLSEALKLREPGCRIVRGERGIYGLRIGQRVPDLIVETTHARWAVELELTAKSNTRYRQILASYQVSSDYDRVLYAVANAAIATKIRSLLGAHLKSGTSPFGRLEKFTFRPMTDLIRSPSAEKSKEPTTTTNTFLGGENHANERL